MEYQVVHVQRGDPVAQLPQPLPGEIESVRDIVPDWPARVIEHSVSVIVLVKTIKSQIHGGESYRKHARKPRQKLDAKLAQTSRTW
jgi:hypothetical protein